VTNLQATILLLLSIGCCLPNNCNAGISDRFFYLKLSGLSLELLCAIFAVAASSITWLKYNDFTLIVVSSSRSSRCTALEMMTENHKTRGVDFTVWRGFFAVFGEGKQIHLSPQNTTAGSLCVCPRLQIDCNAITNREQIVL
jgi:hypothetical protein